MSLSVIVWGKPETSSRYIGTETVLIPGAAAPMGIILVRIWMCFFPQIMFAVLTFVSGLGLGLGLGFARDCNNTRGLRCTAGGTRTVLHHAPGVGQPEVRGGGFTGLALRTGQPQTTLGGGVVLNGTTTQQQHDRQSTGAWVRATGP